MTRSNLCRKPRNAPSEGFFFSFQLFSWLAGNPRAGFPSVAASGGRFRRSDVKCECVLPDVLPTLGWRWLTRL